MKRFVIVFLLFCAPLQAQTLVGDRVRLNAGPCVLSSGSGAPEGARVGSPCDMYVDTVTGTWWTKWTGPATNTGWGVGHNANARVNGNLTLTGFATSPNYASQLTGWRVDNLGAGDFRYLYVDEMHAKAFIADIEQALAGLQIVTKSVAPLAVAFTCPSQGGFSSLNVESFPGFPDVQVFQSGDWVNIRQFSRTLGSLNITDCLGTVSTPVTAGMTQSWLFTRGTGGNAGAAVAGTIIAAKAIVLDYGTSGNGYHEVNSIDGIFAANSPYAQTVTWSGSPAAANRTVRTRTGNLRGITGVVNEFGFYAAGPDAASYLRASNTVLQAVNMDLQLYSFATEVFRVDHNIPSLALGSAVPAGFASGIGVWMGRDTDGLYKFRVGNPAAERVEWTGTSLRVFGQGGGITDINGANIRTGSISADKATFGSGSNQIKNSDCRYSVDEWGNATSSGFVPVHSFGFSGFNLNNEGGTCYLAYGGNPPVNNISYAFTIPTYPVQRDFRYEASAYLGVNRTGSTAVILQWLDINGTFISNANGNTCTTATPGGSNLAGYCRSVVLATAPPTATQARVFIQTTHTGEANPFVFYVHAFFGEATINQTEASPWGPAGLTEIIGGMIKTQTITADKITVGSLTAQQIQAGSITGDRITANSIAADRIQAGSITGAQISGNAITAGHIQANTITGDKIVAGAITADKMNVGSLSAVSADLGNVTAGTISGVTINGVTMNGSSIIGGTIDINGGSFVVIANGSVFGSTMSSNFFGVNNAINIGYLAGGGTQHLCVNNSGLVGYC